MQCLDFYYHITDASYNAKISILWDDNTVKQLIAEVKASSDNQWQHYQRTYMSPLSSSYYVSYNSCYFWEKKYLVRIINKKSQYLERKFRAKKFDSSHDL